MNEHSLQLFLCLFFDNNVKCKYNAQQLLLTSIFISVFKICIHSILYIEFFVYCDNSAYLRHALWPFAFQLKSFVLSFSDLNRFICKSDKTNGNACWYNCVNYI